MSTPLFPSSYTVAENGCWVWNQACFTNGYGAVKRVVNGQKRMWGAHRYQWAMYNGPIPDNLLVLHKCDNPRCINPEHLFLGTQFDNIRDMIAKGRQDFMGMLASRRTGVGDGIGS